ncbi:hypothetical protein EVAR_33388_1 [Eumeta japonica]|uniref:Uncharacterized protein n=1 Tax=Eumeta variegata TaxID=151549 RepID=A0A4C1X4H2_EUMVA|nr:hypothetical protein EVAR_33388_1 [Eumeta japonica]
MSVTTQDRVTSRHFPTVVRRRRSESINDELPPVPLVGGTIKPQKRGGSTCDIFELPVYCDNAIFRIITIYGCEVAAPAVVIRSLSESSGSPLPLYTLHEPEPPFIKQSYRRTDDPSGGSLSNGSLVRLSFEYVI